jgi:hypothetical protein
VDFEFERLNLWRINSFLEQRWSSLSLKCWRSHLDQKLQPSAQNFPRLVHADFYCWLSFFFFFTWNDLRRSERMWIASITQSGSNTYSGSSGFEALIHGCPVFQSGMANPLEHSYWFAFRAVLPSQVPYDFQVENQIIDVLLELLRTAQSDRMREICLGILGNLACHAKPEKIMVETEGFVSMVVKQLFVNDAPSLSEACRCQSWPLVTWVSCWTGCCASHMLWNDCH